MIYARRASGGEHGTVTTRKEIADFMLDLCGYAGSSDLSGIRLLDPSAGDGTFIIAAMRRLFESARRFGFDFQQAAGNLVAAEIDRHKSSMLMERITGCMAGMGKRGFSGGPRIVNGDFLTADLPAFDIIVGNPPYVRHENIPTAKRDAYRNRFSCFRHRSDIYVAFFEKALDCLSVTGQLCFICPNRWLKNRYGVNLRDRLSGRNGIPAIINLNEIGAFKENVSSYPMIILANTDVGLGTIEYFDVHDMSQLGPAVLQRNGKGTRSEHIHKSVPKPKPGELWIFDGNGLAPDTFTGIESQGFEIGIGVATGADSIYIGKNLADMVEEERLLPVVLSRDITHGMIDWSGHHMLNPFEDDGTLVELGRYPLAERYLLSHRKKLSRRHVAKRNPEKNWYRTIDGIRPGLAGRPKLLLPDLKKDRTIAMDDGRYYPHHNLYYIAGGPVVDLKVLGAVLMSEFSLNQLNAVGIHMRGGYTRWQAQSLRRLAIPSIREMPKSMRKSLAILFDRKDMKGINDILNGHIHDNPLNLLYDGTAGSRTKIAADAPAETRAGTPF